MDLTDPLAFATREARRTVRNLRRQLDVAGIANRAPRIARELATAEAVLFALECTPSVPSPTFAEPPCTCVGSTFCAPCRAATWAETNTPLASMTDKATARAPQAVTA